MIAPSMGCCDLFDMERQVRIIDEKSDFLHYGYKTSKTGDKGLNRSIPCEG